MPGSTGKEPFRGAAPRPDRPRESTLCTERFATPDGRARLSAAPHLPPEEEPDADHPLLLVTGRHWAHYNSGSMTRHGATSCSTPMTISTCTPRTPRGTESRTVLPSWWTAATARRG